MGSLKCVRMFDSLGQRSFLIAGEQLHEIPVRVSHESDPQSGFACVAGRPTERPRASTLACASVLSPERAFDLSGTSNSTPSTWNGSSLWPVRATVPESAFIRESGDGDGAFMEPSGRNQRQPVANCASPKTARASKNRCHRSRPVAVWSAW
jgi:hypothetical protein